jgi:hypothetical protein
MTEDEIYKMEAGKELDWEVAKIMGVDERVFNFSYEAGNFNYSTDISSAMEVIEKLSEKCGGDFGFSLGQRKSFYPKWRCTMTVEWTSKQLSTGACATAAEAITKCALFATLEKGYKV